jgi:hypothetical protein
VSGSSRSSSPQVIQSALFPRCGNVFPARLVVDQVDNDVPHDRTPLFDPWLLIPAIRFPVPSRDHENGFVIPREWFRGSLDNETASRVRDRRNPDPALIAHGAKHNAAKRNMIAWRRCVSMLGAKIPSRALSAEVVPRFDAARRYIRKPPLVTEGAGADRLTLLAAPLHPNWRDVLGRIPRCEYAPRRSGLSRRAASRRDDQAGLLPELPAPGAQHRSRSS